MKKEFTVGDMINALKKFDSDLPMFDCYNDENEGACWFNLEKPKPKIKTLYLLQRNYKSKTVLKLTDDKEDAKKSGWTILETKKVMVLYPLVKGEIEIG